MRTQSKKAKGRRLQQWVRDLLIEKLEVEMEDELDEEYYRGEYDS